MKAGPKSALSAADAASVNTGGIPGNVAAMLANIPDCLPVLGLVFGFLLEPYKNDRFVRFHAWQSLALRATFLAASLVLAAIVHLIGAPTFPTYLLIGLGTLAPMIFLMAKAYRWETFKLPLIGPWAEQQANR